VATLVATPPSASRLAYLLGGATSFWGKSLLDAPRGICRWCCRGRDRVSAAARLRQSAGSSGRSSPSISASWFAFRWTGAALACGVGVMSFPLLVRPIRLSIEAVDRRLEQAAETFGGARPMAGVLQRHIAARAARRALPAWCSALPRRSVSSARTITFVSKHSRRNPDDFVRDLFADPRRRTGDTAALRLVLISVAIAVLGADRRRSVRAPRDATPAREPDHVGASM